MHTLETCLPYLLQGVQASIQPRKAHVLVCILLATGCKPPLFSCYTALVLLRMSPISRYNPAYHLLLSYA